MSASSDHLISRSVVLPSGVDLHARPAGLLARAAASHPATVVLRANGRQADAKSILQVLALGATGGSTLLVEAAGPGSSEALDAITTLLETLV